MLSPGLWPEVAWTLYRTFGARGVWLRARHELRRRVGGFLSKPRHAVVEFSIASAHPFAVSAESLRLALDPAEAISRAERVLSGEHEAYRSTWCRLPDSPESWLTHPLTGAVADSSAQWWRVAHLNAALGDIKEIWEPARFAWAYDLVRGYLLTGEDRFARHFFQHFTSWHQSSPPYLGPQWSCGQESAIRAVALLYAEANLAEAPSNSAAAMVMVRETLAASGERIADAIGYGISQRNNHGISEAAGLIALGVRFQDAHPAAAKWLHTGRRVLERLIDEQFAVDGWYIQHSFTYLRLALDQCVIAERAMRSVGLSLSPEAISRLKAAVDLLLTVMDPTSGIVPNYGANDGAFVHPITLAPYRDFRPVVTAVCAMWQHPMPANVEPDVETLAWLGCARPPTSDPIGDGVHSGPSGWAVARAGTTVAFLRAGKYQSRPGHLDPLHLDVRIAGEETVVDPGSFAYNAPPPWRNGLAGAHLHNGPVVDDREPGVRGPRFLWYIWPAAKLLRALRVGDEFVLEAAVEGVVTRTVRVREGVVRVEDRVVQQGASTASVTWLLHPDADPNILSAPHSRVIEASEGDTKGWFSPGYGIRIASRSVLVQWSPQTEPLVRTTIGAVGGSSTDQSDEVSSVSIQNEQTQA